MGLKTWITGMFLSASLSGHAQEVKQEVSQKDSNAPEIKSSVKNFVTEATYDPSIEQRFMKHLQKVRTSLNTPQQLDNEFGEQGSKISSDITIREASQQDLSLNLPEEENPFYKDMQQMIQDELQTTMSEFEKRINDRTKELHTKYGNFIANSLSDNQPFAGDFHRDFSIRYDLEKGSVVLDWQPVTKRPVPMKKSLRKKLEKLAEY